MIANWCSSQIRLGVPLGQARTKMPQFLCYDAQGAILPTPRFLVCTVIHNYGAPTYEQTKIAPYLFRGKWTRTPPQGKSCISCIHHTSHFQEIRAVCNRNHVATRRRCKQSSSEETMDAFCQGSNPYADNRAARASKRRKTAETSHSQNQTRPQVASDVRFFGPAMSGALDRAVTDAVNRAMTDVVNRAVTIAAKRAVTEEVKRRAAASTMTASSTSMTAGKNRRDGALSFNPIKLMGTFTDADLSKKIFLNILMPSGVTDPSQVRVSITEDKETVKLMVLSPSLLSNGYKLFKDTMPNKGEGLSDELINENVKVLSYNSLLADIGFKHGSQEWMTATIKLPEAVCYNQFTRKKFIRCSTTHCLVLSLDLLVKGSNFFEEVVEFEDV